MHQAKDRKEWMKKMNFSHPSSWSLHKQKHMIMETLSKGTVLTVEQAILDVARFPNAVGEYTVTLTDKLSYSASFLYNDEKVVKEFTKLSKVYEWLLSMAHAFKKGTLHSSNRSIEKSSRPSVAIEKASNTIQGQSDTNAAAAMLQEEQPASSQVAATVTDVTDVTGDILVTSKTMTVPLKPSEICIHRGSFNTFMKCGHSNASLFGLMLGKTVWNAKFHVTNIVLSTVSIEALLENTKVIAMAKGLELEICGAMIKGTEDVFRENRSKLFDLFRDCEFPLLICADYSTIATGVAICCEHHVDTEVKAVTPSWTTQPHNSQRRLTYNICWDTECGVSHMERATEKICEAVVKHVCHEALPHKRKTNIHQGVPVRMRRCNVPADGRCGWHSLLGASNVKKFLLVPRGEAGYAINATVREAEDMAAKDLHMKTCQDALQTCPERYHKAIKRVQENPSFHPADLEWIALVIKMCIRCTCAKEAQMF